MTRTQEAVLDEIEHIRGYLDELEHQVRAKGRASTCSTAQLNLTIGMFHLTTSMVCGVACKRTKTVREKIDKLRAELDILDDELSGPSDPAKVEASLDNIQLLVTCMNRDCGAWIAFRKAIEEEVERA